MSTLVPIKPAVISWALHQADVSPTDLKQSEKVEKWLDGSAQPTFNQLQDFARAIHLPFGYLMMSEPPVLEKPIPDFRIRKNNSTRYSQELTEAINLQQLRQDWFRDYAIDQGFDHVSWVESATLQEDPSEVAAKLRIEWNFSTLENAQPYEDSRREIFNFVEDLDVLISVAGYIGSNRRGFDVEEFSGFSLFDHYAPLIFVNGKESHAAQIFTIFHELGHLVLGQSGVSEPSIEQVVSHSESTSEQWCDEFAASFLMPAPEVRSMFEGDLSENSILRLARRFRVSALSFLNRLRDLNLITFKEWETVYPEFERRALEILQKKAEQKSPSEDFYRTQRFITGVLFAQAVYRDARNGRTSYPEAQKLVGLKKTATFEKFTQEGEHNSYVETYKGSYTSSIHRHDK